MYASVAGVLYVLVGYPLMIATSAKVRCRPIRRTEHAPTVTLVVPCHNEVDVIAAKLANLTELDYPRDRLDIVVVDDGSTDGTGDVVRNVVSGLDAEIRLLARVERAGKAVAINHAVAESSSDVIALSDATALWDRGALRALVRSFGDDEVGAVSGRMSYGGAGVGQVLDLYWRYEDSIRAWESASGSTVGVNGNVFAIRRADATELPAGTVNDELTLALRAAIGGRRVVFDRDAYAADIPSPSMSVESGRRSRMTAGRLLATMGPARGIWTRPGLAVRFVSHKLLRPFVPVMAGFAVIAAWATMLSTRSRPTDRVLASAIVASSGAVVVAAGVGHVLEGGGRPVPLALRGAHLVTSSAIASVVGIVRAATGRQQGTWTKRPSEAVATASAEPERS